MSAADGLAALLGEEIVSRTRLQGGDLSEVTRIEAASGTTAIAKAGPTARAEAEMLRAIAATGAPAPAVLAVADDLLVLEDLGRDTGLSGAWGDLGRCVRRLHDGRGEDYGWSRDHAFGPVVIPNAPTASWPDFWAERRLLAGLSELPAELGRRLEQLCARLGERLPAHPPASLLHGDLWAGNVLAADGRVLGLIDPACYYGHSEVDLAMLDLFGSPDPAFREGYGAPEPGLDERRPIYQLWPALVHLRLFGGGYRPLVDRLISAVS